MARELEFGQEVTRLQNLSVDILVDYEWLFLINESMEARVHCGDSSD